MAGALLITVLALAWICRKDKAEYDRFNRLIETRDRQGRWRQWIVKTWLAFGLSSLIGLALLDRLSAVWRMPDEFAPARMPISQLSPVVGGWMAGVVAMLALSRSLQRRRCQSKMVQLPRVARGLAAIVPRNRGEMGYGAALSLTAGIVEELFFRLLLPLLVTMISGSAMLGFGTALVIFGAMHQYQGLVGIVASLVVGALLTFVYLASGTLWLSVVLHALIDLAGLVVRPALAGVWRISASAATRS